MPDKTGKLSDEQYENANDWLKQNRALSSCFCGANNWQGTLRAVYSLTAARRVPRLGQQPAIPCQISCPDTIRTYMIFCMSPDEPMVYGATPLARLQARYARTLPRRILPCGDVRGYQVDGKCRATASGRCPTGSAQAQPYR